MPKLKTHKGVSKRFKLTGTGKLMRRKAYGRHLLTAKGPARKRRLGTATETEPGDAAKVKVMLPYGLD